MGISSTFQGQDYLFYRQRNLLYNGAMQVHQRVAAATGVTGITSSGYYTADRWRMGIASAGTWTASVENDAPTGSGFRKSLKVLCTTASSSLASGAQFRVHQNLEGQDIQDIRKGTSSAEYLTLSFWVKSNVTGTFIVELYDDDNNRQCSKSYTISASGVWEKKTLTFPPDTTGAFDNDNNSSFRCDFWLVAGSDTGGGTLNTSWAANVPANRAVGQTNLAAATNNYWQITGVQLNIGPVATPFEHRPIGVELALCQRYYWRTGGTPFCPLGIANTQSTTAGRVYIKLPVTMRRDPTGLTLIGSAPSVGSGTYSTLSFDRASTDAVMGYLAGTGFTAGGAQMIYGNGDGTTFMEITGAEL